MSADNTIGGDTSDDSHLFGEVDSRAIFSNPAPSRKLRAGYEAKNIHRKADTEYFLHIKEEQDRIKAEARQVKCQVRRANFLRFGCPILVVCAIAALVVAANHIYNLSIERRAAETAAAEAAMKTAAETKANEIELMSYSDSETAVEDTIRAFEDALADADNDIERRVLELYYTEYLAFGAGRYDEAIAKLNEYTENYTNDEYCDVIGVYIGAYDGLGDKEALSRYEKINAEQCSSEEGDNGGRG